MRKLIGLESVNVNVDIHTHKHTHVHIHVHMQGGKGNRRSKNRKKSLSETLAGGSEEGIGGGGGTLVNLGDEQSKQEDTYLYIMTKAAIQGHGSMAEDGSMFK